MMEQIEASELHNTFRRIPRVHQVPLRVDWGAFLVFQVSLSCNVFYDRQVLNVIMVLYRRSMYIMCGVALARLENMRRKSRRLGSAQQLS